MYKTIIVPLDGSTRSRGALPAAAKLAARCRATLELVRVHVGDSTDVTDDPSWDQIRRQGEQQHLEVLAEAYGPVADGLVLTALLDEPVVESLCNFAASRPDPLVVMTARGRTGLRRALLGSVADDMVREGSAPVLILRDTAADGAPRTWSAAAHPLRTIVVPLDGTGFAEAAVDHAVGLAQAMGAGIHLIRVLGAGTGAAVFGAIALHPLLPFDETAVIRNDQAHDYLQGVVHRIGLGDPTRRVTTEVALADNPGTAIAESCDRHHAGLIVMATHGRGSSRLFVGSISDRMLKDGPEAILLLRPSARTWPTTLRVESTARKTAGVT